MLRPFFILYSLFVFLRWRISEKLSLPFVCFVVFALELNQSIAIFLLIAHIKHISNFGLFLFLAWQFCVQLFSTSKPGSYRTWCWIFFFSIFWSPLVVLKWNTADHMRENDVHFVFFFCEWKKFNNMHSRFRTSWDSHQQQWGHWCHQRKHIETYNHQAGSETRIGTITRIFPYAECKNILLLCIKSPQHFHAFHIRSESITFFSLFFLLENRFCFQQ